MTGPAVMMLDSGMKTVTVFEFTKVPVNESRPKFTVGCAKQGPSQFASLKLVPFMVSVKPNHRPSVTRD